MPLKNSTRKIFYADEEMVIAISHMDTSSDSAIRI